MDGGDCNQSERAGRIALLRWLTACCDGLAHPLPPAAEVALNDWIIRMACAEVAVRYSPGLPEAVYDELLRIEIARLREDVCSRCPDAHSTWRSPSTGNDTRR